VAQSVGRRSVAVKARVRSLESHVTFVGDEVALTGIGLSPDKSVLFCQCHSAFAAQMA
jgi:hypothetical protein